MEARKSHWENIYNTKDISTVSWYQTKPSKSLDLIAEFNLDKDAAIIDIGGGDSFLPDFLLKLGYSNISVLDISEKAIENAKIRLGEDAEKIKWIVSDITKFTPSEKYDLWHDRAAFHFLTDDQEIENYVQLVSKSLKPNASLIIGTFSENGPTKCSGIEIKQYSQENLIQLFSAGFEKLQCENVDHETPSGALQNFTFCTFRKRD